MEKNNQHFSNHLEKPKKSLLKLLYSALLDLRLLGHELKKELVYFRADLVHRIPNILLGSRGNQDAYLEIVQSLRFRAKDPRYSQE